MQSSDAAVPRQKLRSCPHPIRKAELFFNFRKRGRKLSDNVWSLGSRSRRTCRDLFPACACMCPTSRHKLALKAQLAARQLSQQHALPWGGMHEACVSLWLRRLGCWLSERRRFGFNSTKLRRTALCAPSLASGLGLFRRIS